MYAYIQVENASAHISLSHRGKPASLEASTFPIVPPGTLVKKLNCVFPKGLHAVYFYAHFRGQVQQGSGKATRLEYVDEKDISLLLSWYDDEKLVVKSSDDMKEAEFLRFNPFLVSGASIIAVDTEKRISYVCGDMPSRIAEDWVYKTVSIDSMLAYVTKRMTLAELDAAATNERRAFDEVAALRRNVAYCVDENRELHEHLRIVSVETGQLQETITQLRAQNAKPSDDLMKAERATYRLVRSLYHFLDWRVVRLTKFTKTYRQLQRMAAAYEFDDSEKTAANLIAAVAELDCN